MSDQNSSKGETDTGRARMAPKADSPPGQEQDACGNVIPFEQRTKDDQEKAAKD